MSGLSSHRAPVLAIVLVSYLMIVIDISIVITGLPKIQQSFALSAAELSWVQNAYTLAFGGLLLLGARAGDILGRRRMFVAGLALFTVASLAVGLAQSAAWLLPHARSRESALRFSRPRRLRCSRRTSPKGPSAFARSPITPPLPA